MELNNIEKAKMLFPDAVKLQIRINQPATIAEVRKLLPSCVVLLSCKISKNYASIIYSEGAGQRMFPDVANLIQNIELGNGQNVKVYSDEKNKGVKLLLDFLPNSNKELMQLIGLAFGEKMYQVSDFDECSMGCIFFANTNIEDVIRILMLVKEEE